jgi:gliding motility-associated-like protein
MALSENGGTPVTQQNISSVPGNPPVIFVDSKGCTDADVIFSSSGSGNWNFGSGATPMTGTGTGPIAVTYSTTGRKDISFSGTTFTGFIEIFQNAGVSNTINPANGSTTNGCPETFSTTATGSLYEWDFGPNALPPTASGATLTSTDVIFLTPGVYTVRLWVTTACCGRVKDSTTITVNPNSINVSLTMSPSGGACSGQPLTFTASPSTYQAYNFLVNGVSVQNTSNSTYSSSSLTDGDTVTVLAFDGVCYSNPSANVIAVVFPIPTVTLTSSDADNEICEGESITFTASPAGLDNYEFFNNGVSVQSGSSNTYTTTTLTSPNSVHVIATDNGCPSQPSNAIVTNVILSPVVTIVSSDADNQICEGDNITFTATPPGFDNYEFFENGVSVQSGSGNTYSTGNLPNNTTVTVAATQNGCVGPVSNSIQTAVYTYPTVTLTDDDADDIICEGTPVTFTASPAGLTTYEFFDNGIPADSSSSNTWTTSTLQPGNTITVVGTNVICSSSPSNAISIQVVPAPFVDAGIDREICISNTIIPLTGYSPSGGTWSGPGIIDANAGTFNPNISGTGINQLFYTYTDSVTLCPATDTLLFTVHDLPDASFFASPVLVETDSSAPVTFTYTGTPATQYLWNFGDGYTSTDANPVHYYADTGFYTISLIVTNSNGCIDTVVRTRYIEVINKPVLFIPDAFSPNGDGVNDELFIYGSGFKEFTFRIFDRWGTQVYESSSLNQGWKGTFNGKELEQGVYVYMFKAVYTNNTIHNFKGSITLLR